ncbi:hypothetical protein MPSEU_000695200 [Mayamaea pseudoterrestris]|nr:hypothetical protein MPSEU_000695200 [Mayamaea pseudoterrestris]
MWKAIPGRILRTGSLPNRLQTIIASRLSTASTIKQEGSPQIVEFVRLNNLQDNPGAVKKKRRVGRGIGSSKGKTSGRGHKGQKSRSGGSIPPTFEGGQTKFYKLLPKRGMNNKRHESPMFPLNLNTIQNYIDMGRIDASQRITLRELQLAGIYKASAVKHGVKLLADGKENIKQPLDLLISRASEAAIDAVEQAGGQVSTVHYNRLALRVLLRPHRYEDKYIRQARPPPKWQPYYTNWKTRGYLHPAVQLREFLRGKPDLESRFEEVRKKQDDSASINN